MYTYGKLSLMSKGIYSSDIIVGVKCDGENVTAHSLKKDVLTLKGNFLNDIDIKHLFKTIFKSKPQRLIRAYRECAFFYVDERFIKTYKKIMRYNKLTYIALDSHIKTLSNNVFYTKPIVLHCSNIDPIGYFDDHLRMIDEPNALQHSFCVLEMIDGFEYRNLNNVLNKIELKY